MTRSECPADGMHRVRAGEWVASIADRYGFLNWRVIWDHPKNAELRRTRKSPNLLVPGDMVFIPERDLRSEAGSTEQQHRFRLEPDRDFLRICLLDEEGRRIANARYRLELTTDGSAEFVQENERTDAGGVLEEEIPRTAKSGRLEVPKLGVAVNLLIGHLRPIDSTLDPHEDREAIATGVRQRLHNLLFGEALDDEGLDPPAVEQCVRQFQAYCSSRKEKLGYDAGPVDGKITPQVRQALLRAHDDSDDY